MKPTSKLEQMKQAIANRPQPGLGVAKPVKDIEPVKPAEAKAKQQPPPQPKKKKKSPSQVQLGRFPDQTAITCLWKGTPQAGEWTVEAAIPQATTGDKPLLLVQRSRSIHYGLTCLWQDYLRRVASGEATSRPQISVDAPEPAGETVHQT